MRILLTILIFTALLVGGFLFYMGMFSSYEVNEENIGPFKYVYQQHIGPYKETGQVGMEVYNNLKEDGIETTQGLGIYYDKPKDTPADQLRSEMGSIVEEKDFEKLLALGDKYNVKDIPKTYSMVVRFPIRNVLSYMVGPMKVYPLMEKYMVERGYKAEDKDVGYEVYDMENNLIIYTLPIHR